MHVVTFTLSDELYEILEQTLSPAEMDVFINQAVRRHIEESVHQEKATETKDKVDDMNNHEWTK